MTAREGVARLWEERRKLDVDPAKWEQRPCKGGVKGADRCIFDKAAEMECGVYDTTTACERLGLGDSGYSTIPVWQAYERRDPIKLDVTLRALEIEVEGRLGK
jgi:hypothetical protein